MLHVSHNVLSSPHSFKILTDSILISDLLIALEFFELRVEYSLPYSSFVVYRRSTYVTSIASFTLPSGVEIAGNQKAESAYTY